MVKEPYDKFGHCIWCGKQTFMPLSCEGEITIHYSPDYDESVYILDNDSKMGVNTCAKCKTASLYLGVTGEYPVEEVKMFSSLFSKS